jgi:hypothetical protein
MPSWNDLRVAFEQQPNDQAKLKWLEIELGNALARVSACRNGRNVMFYASAFLQKPTTQPVFTMMTMEDLNGLMAVMPGIDIRKRLTLILHTPGGDPGAANALMAYLHAKFDEIEAIVPTYAMSAGTMLALGTNRIVMGRQSQLGPIDAQMQTTSGLRSAGAMVDAFERAKADILVDTKLAHLWHPILQAMGPSIFQEAQNNLDFGEAMVQGWLTKRMLKDVENAADTATRIAKHFNATNVHKNHSRRIDRDEARATGLTIEDLEADQECQDAVLTAYHVASLNFSVTKAVKFLACNNGIVWQKNTT